MHSFSFKVLFTIVCIVLFVGNINAQFDSCNVFLKGNYLEVGISNNGAFGSTLPAPTGYHSRANGYPMENVCTGRCNASPGNAKALGFVADPDKDGWTKGLPAYYGDFIMAGATEEGWALQMHDSVMNGFLITQNCSLTGAIPLYPPWLGTGNNILYGTTGKTMEGLWQGMMDSVMIEQLTSLDTDKLYITVRVTLKNTSHVLKNDVYYLRFISANPELSLTGSFMP